MTDQVIPARSVLRLAETLFLLVFCTTNCAFQAQATPVISNNEVVNYLSTFGYLKSLDSTSEEPVSKQDLAKAISSFQSFMGVDVTGKMDPKTTKLMSLPRCGMKDKLTIKLKDNGKSEAYQLFGTKWEHNRLTYQITKYPSARLSRNLVDQEIARAFAVWSEYTDLTFSPQNYGQVDIEIRFESGYHGDEHPFDGPGQILAHAYAPGPGMGGDAHFDDQEPWTINSGYGISLFQVAAHEFGHALGLDHSRVPSALMAPFYRDYQPDFKLDDDDIRGIQAIYGPKTGLQHPPVYGYPGYDNSIDDYPGWDGLVWGGW